jgi:hypothetical protein
MFESCRVQEPLAEELTTNILTLHLGPKLLRLHTACTFSRSKGVCFNACGIV